MDDKLQEKTQLVDAYKELKKRKKALEKEEKALKEKLYQFPELYTMVDREVFDKKALYAAFPELEGQFIKITSYKKLLV